MGNFQPNPHFERDLFHSEEATEAVYERGDIVLDAADRMATAEASTGDFAVSLEIDHHRTRSGRPVSTVYSDDEGALSVEFGTRITEPHRFLGRALDTVRK